MNRVRRVFVAVSVAIGGMLALTMGVGAIAGGLGALTTSASDPSVRPSVPDAGRNPVAQVVQAGYPTPSPPPQYPTPATPEATFIVATKAPPPPTPAVIGTPPMRVMPLGDLYSQPSRDTN